MHHKFSAGITLVNMYVAATAMPTRNMILKTIFFTSFSTNNANTIATIIVVTSTIYYPQPSPKPRT